MQRRHAVALGKMADALGNGTLRDRVMFQEKRRLPDRMLPSEERSRAPFRTSSCLLSGSEAQAPLMLAAMMTALQKNQSTVSRSRVFVRRGALQ